MEERKGERSALTSSALTAHHMLHIRLQSNHYTEYFISIRWCLFSRPLLWKQTLQTTRLHFCLTNSPESLLWVVGRPFQTHRSKKAKKQKPSLTCLKWKMRTSNNSYGCQCTGSFKCNLHFINQHLTCSTCVHDVGTFCKWFPCGRMIKCGH